MFEYDIEETVWVDNAPIDCPLFDVISSVPEGREFIVQLAVAWKSGCEDMDWIANVVVQTE